MKMTTSLGEKLTILGTVLLFVFVFYLTWFRLDTSRSCLKAGYPSAQIDISLNRYCTKRVDQTDVVKPLEELEKVK